MQFKHRNKTVIGYFTQHVYANNDNYCIRITGWNPDGYWEPYCTLSLNTDLILPHGEFVAKNFDENATIPETLLAQGYFQDTGRRCEEYDAPIYRITEKFTAEVGQIPETYLRQGSTL